jgi:hypothetical protein
MGFPSRVTRALPSPQFLITIAGFTAGDPSLARIVKSRNAGSAGTTRSRTKARSAASYPSLLKPSLAKSTFGGDSHDFARGSNSRGDFVVSPFNNNSL